MVDDGCSTEGCSAKEGQEYYDYVYNVVYGNVDKKANAEKVEAVLNGGTSFALGIVAPPVGLFFSAINEEEISSFDIALAFIPTSNLIPDNLSSYDDILKYAKEKYPKLADKINLHHIEPKYLGGDPNGPVIALNGAYHQLITNEFRRLWEYGKGITPTTEKLQEMVDFVYSIFPLP